MWEVIEPGVALIPNWHIEYICDQLQDVYERWELMESQPDVLINVPPGSSKSTIVTQSFPAWLWVRNKSVRIISSSYSADLSTAHAIKSRDILASEKFTALFGKTEFKRDQSGKTHYKNRFGGERFVTSTGGMVTGMHADFIIDDDPINPKQAASQASLETAKEFSTRTLPSRKTDKKRTVTIRVMQRLHDMDPSGIWLSRKTKKLRHICLPGLLSDNVRPVELKERYVDGLLDPIRLDHAALQEMKDDLGSLAFAQQIQQVTAPEEGNIWKRWFVVVPDNVFPDADTLSAYGTDYDTAYTDKQVNDAMAWCTSGKIDKKIYIDKIGYAREEMPGMLRRMAALPEPAYIEAKASGKSSKQMLNTAGIAAIEVPVIGGDKVARTKMATPAAEAGLVHIRESLISLLYDDHEQGILHFPNAPHDDLNDAVVQAIQRHWKPPFKVRSL
jgi:predicted phage terminase large subunit-like protein